MKEEIEKIDQEIKVQKALLQTLDIQFKSSPYNHNPKAIARKKEAIKDKIDKLEQSRNQIGTS